MSLADTIWGIDFGKASLGESVRQDGRFLHVESLIIPQDFAEIKTAAASRRQKRTRDSHKAREKFLERCLKECGIEVLKRRSVEFLDGRWVLASKGDKRLEREFPAPGENICYNSIALRCKLLLGERLEPWQVFKALNSAIQKRGYDGNLPWKEKEERISSKKEEDDYQKNLQIFEEEKRELLAPLENPQNYDYPCFFKAYKMGLWNPENPENVGIKIAHTAQRAKGYIIPRKDVEREFVRLVEMASLQYPKLAGKALYILYGYSETAYASYNPKIRKEFNLKRGAITDLTALGQKVPRFDNRIIAKCALIPRFNVCKIKPLAGIKNDADLLHYEITLALKLLNLRFYRLNSLSCLAFNEFLELFDSAKSKKYKLTKTDIAKFFKKIGASPIENNCEIEAPRESGRARYSRPAMMILKDLIFSGKNPAEYYGEKIKTVENIDPRKGLVAEDFEFVKLMGDAKWNNIYIPDVQSHQFAQAQAKRQDVDELINKIIGGQNDPIVRHRLAFFYERVKALHEKFGVPQKIILEFVRDDFLGDKRKAELHKQMKARRDEKQKIAKKLDELSESPSDSREGEIKFKSGKMLIKMELLEKQKGMCVYTGNPLCPADLPGLEIEHIVPRAKGGPDALYNYVLTTESVNKEKGNRTPYEWLSPNPEEWEKYCRRVKDLSESLGKKRCALLVGEDAQALAEKYTGLAETAWIAKLAQKILCLYFGFQIGANEGQKRVFTVSGNTTSLIRSAYGLNKLLHNEDVDREKMSAVDYLIKIEALDKKNRANKKHHALDAMCLTFAPAGKDMRKVKINEILPKEIAEDAEGFFGKYLDALIPNEVAVEKPRLEDSIYAKKEIAGKSVMVKRFKLEELAYKNVGVNKKVYDLHSLQKNIKNIVSAQIRKIAGDFAQSRPSENDWINWCKTVEIPSRFGRGSKILRVQAEVGDPAEYKDLSKDSCGAYRKGASHKGQIIWKNKKGKFIVAPIYAFSSKFKVLNELGAREDFDSIVGEFRKHCLVKIESDVFNDKGDLLLSAGIYMVNTILADGRMKFTNPNGENAGLINIQHLMKAGITRIKLGR